MNTIRLWYLYLCGLPSGSVKHRRLVGLHEPKVSCAWRAKGSSRRNINCYQPWYFHIFSKIVPYCSWLSSLSSPLSSPVIIPIPCCLPDSLIFEAHFAAAVHQGCFCFGFGSSLLLTETSQRGMVQSHSIRPCPVATLRSLKPEISATCYSWRRLRRRLRRNRNGFATHNPNELENIFFSRYQINRD